MMWDTEIAEKSPQRSFQGYFYSWNFIVIFHIYALAALFCSYIRNSIHFNFLIILNIFPCLHTC